MRNETKKSTKKNDNVHDNFFRGSFKLTGIARRHLNDALPKDILEHLDLDKLILAPESYIDEQLSESISDVVYECSTKQNNKMRICFLYEHKSFIPKVLIYLQLLRYILNIWLEDYSKKRHLSVVIPIVVYHGKREWNVKPFKNYFPKLPKAFDTYIWDLPYILTNISAMSVSEIEENKNLDVLRSIYLLLKNAFDKKVLIENFEKIVKFVEDSDDEIVVEMIFPLLMSYFQRRTNFSEKEMTKIVDQLPKNSWKMKKTLFEKWQEEKNELRETNTKLLERLEKMEAKELQFVQSLVINTDFDDDKIALLANVSLDLVKKIRKDLSVKS
jgi:hypothetical protein